MVNVRYRYLMQEIDGPDRAYIDAMDPAQRAWIIAFLEAGLQNMKGEKPAKELLAIAEEIIAFSRQKEIAMKPPADNVIRMETGPHHFLENALQHYLADKEEHTEDQLHDLRIATLTWYHNAVGWPHDGLPANDG